MVDLNNIKYVSMDKGAQPEGFELGLKIAGIPCIVTCESQSLFQRLEKRLAGFECHVSNKDKTLHFFIAQGNLPSRNNNARNNTNQSSYSNSVVMISKAEGSCAFNLKTNRGNIFLNCRGKRMVNFIHFSLMQIYRFILPFHNSIAIHASSVFYKNRGTVFAGPSGSGKTTVVKLLPSYYTVLHDDLAFIRYENKRFYIYAPPVSSPCWDGLNCNKRILLDKILFLNKGPCNKIHKITMPEAVMKLMQNVHGVGIHPNTAKIFQLCTRASRIVSMHNLVFSNRIPLFLNSQDNKENNRAFHKT